MRISTRGRVTIPKAIRDEYGLTPGTQIAFVELPDGIKLVKRSRFGEYCGYLKDRWVIGDIDQYLRESRGRD